jgi:hypothetical protein
MPQIANPLAGAEAVASGEVIFQGCICFPSGSAPFTSAISMELQARLATTNLPNLQWYLYLEHGYLEPSTGILHNAQLNITWQPVIHQARANGLSAPSMGLPFSAPAILPVGTPVRINVRAPVIDIGFRLDAPSLAPAPETISSIQFLLCASQ